MKNVSEIIRIQAKREFARKRKDIIKNNLNKHKNKTENFADILNLYLQHIS